MPGTRKSSEGTTLVNQTAEPCVRVKLTSLGRARTDRRVTRPRLELPQHGAKGQGRLRDSTDTSVVRMVSGVKISLEDPKSDRVVGGFGHPKRTKRALEVTSCVEEEKEEEEEGEEEEDEN